jgi:hypothetical protein
MVLSSTYQSTDNPLLSTLYEPLSKHLITVLGGPQLGGIEGERDRYPLAHALDAQRARRSPKKWVACTSGKSGARVRGDFRNDWRVTK